MEQNNEQISIEEHIDFEQVEPVVKRGRGRPRLPKVEQSEPVVKRPPGRPIIDSLLQLLQKRGRKPHVGTEDPQENKPRDRPKFIHLDVSDILRMLNIVFANTIMQSRIESVFRTRTEI